jgi:4-diphosphocytidyl-2-C-methyl-D-erythritol kinase
MTLPTVERAYAKVNLCLFLGPTRADGRHELVTLFDSLTLADELEVTPAPSGDTVLCAGVRGPNLVADALAALRAAGWDAPGLRVAIEKRIPVAAGMGGGSADAAALLRLAPRLATVEPDVVAEIAAGLGADVPAQLDPGPSLGTGAGEILQPLRVLPPYGVLVLPQPFPLSTAAVYREADRLGLARTSDELSALHDELTSAVPDQLPDALLVNDLQPAAVSLAPVIEDALQAVRDAGADRALVCGSGPTVIGLYAGADGLERAASAAHALQARFPAATVAAPVGRGVLDPTPNE